MKLPPADPRFDDAAVRGTVPADITADAGPRHRGGPLAFAVVLSASLVALGLGLALWRDGLAWPAAVCLAAFGLIAVRVGWGLRERLRHHETLPRTHAVLTDHLGFRLDFTCRDVAMTAFFSPDAVTAGGETRLLCFLENYASRQRVAEFLVGPHPQLGLTEAQPLRLHLAAGQAAVYVWPLRVAATLPPGEHDLPITLRIRRPAGTGVLLPGARRHLHNLWTVHFAAPLTVARPAAGGEGTAPRGAEASAAVAAPLYLSLASVSEPKPRLEALGAQLG